MLQVRVTVDGVDHGCVTDEAPNVGFALVSDVAGEALAGATIRCGSYETATRDQINNSLEMELEPWSSYCVEVEAQGTSGERARGEAEFRTGRLGRAWTASWICDDAAEVPEKASPVPVTFRRRFTVADKPINRMWFEATAFGVYEAELDGKKVGNQYLAPGFTSYAHQLQYQTYELEGVNAGEHVLDFHVAGGWAVGAFTYGRKNKISADRQALLAELHIRYADGSEELIPTDTTWHVTQEGPYRAADLYDGEEYDATVALNDVAWRAASIEHPREVPLIVAAYGPPVRTFAPLEAKSCTKAASGEWVYDFGQNTAGVIRASIRGKRGQLVTFRHAEVLVDGELFTKPLRTAKAQATYRCRDGVQVYQPKLTYMGFRYVGMSGARPEDVEICVLPFHSDVGRIGSFSCSNPDINQLQSNIEWGGLSNFVEVPTDCPQRDEREGWTGDASVFARTACFNFDMDGFYRKWLRDMRSEQGRGGGIPMVVPKQGDPWPAMATSCWGDACVLVPWATYLSRGNRRVLEECYPMMKRFLKAADWWSHFLSVTPTGRAIWRWPFHFGDWCAPGEGVTDWVNKGKWVGTAYHAQSLDIVAQIAELLGYDDDATRYRARRDQVVRAYRKAFTDGKGRLRKKEFQTAYVLPLHFGMTEGAETHAMAENLEHLVRENGYRLSTGFTGTPYLLFALSDTGFVDAAYRVLLQEECPSWLYEVRAGATTIWERWDALRPDGSVNIGNLTGKDDDAGMVSFNHYANGAVGDWLYRRMVGLEPIEAGWYRFSVKPLPGGGITWAEAKTESPYGTVFARWEIVEASFMLEVHVPVSCAAVISLPNEETCEVGSGVHRFKVAWEESAHE
ncbi:family 78 glycoside hydrolase catalytic domain [uncultured Enorma sp.]|uniref:alpha-L-rhamnosidase n=1 Tax=uncultured Enorma sp. TaxID=1714346 RepID=UPI0028064EEC|nr:family 78 glycoside hydrolase catalytic domain [uncultured Enorma sp.]